ncbi:MAG TPA: prephenate dehydratase domain-containing protein [Kofleriaceae bacterium]
MDLSKLRERIDAVDRQIIALLADRLRIVEEVALAKLEAASPFRDRDREERLLLRLREHATAAGLDAHAVERIYRVVMDMSVAHQEAHVRARIDAPLRIAYQGVEGSYSHLAAQRRYGGRDGGALLVGYDSFRAAGDAVISGAADLALLPIENTTAGSINETYDLLDGLFITGEVVSKISHCLLALPGVTLAELRTVGSHPQALAQCQSFFAEHTQLKPQPEFDTAGAARRVVELGDRTHGAIASAAAASTYGLVILAPDIQTAQGNATRFVEISRHAAPVAADAAAKTSLVVALADRPGVLGEILTRFAARGLSLTKLESRPIPNAPFTYRFYVDVLGHADGEAFQQALAEVRPLTTGLRILGTYATDRR